MKKFALIASLLATTATADKARDDATRRITTAMYVVTEYCGATPSDSESQDLVDALFFKAGLDVNEKLTDAEMQHQNDVTSGKWTELILQESTMAEDELRERNLKWAVFCVGLIETSPELFD